MNALQYFLKAFFCFLLLAGMTSCIGINADIVFNSDNSGTLNLEYRISRVLDSLGLLDSNEGRPPVPVGKVDFERTLDRLPGMKMVSYNSGEDSKDRIITVKLQFSNMDTFIGFMDAAGEKAVYSAGESKKLTFVLNRENRKRNLEFDTLLNRISSGYRVNISVSFPSEGTMTLLDSTGPLKPEALIPAASGDSLVHANSVETVGQGKKVSCSLPLAAVLTAEKLALEFRW